MSVAAEIHNRLETVFSPEELKVLNESAQHKGHAGDDGSGESHFRVIMKSSDFKEMSRLQRHRAVYRALGPELVSHIHALALELDG